MKIEPVTTSTPLSYAKELPAGFALKASKVEKKPSLAKSASPQIDGRLSRSSDELSNLIADHQAFLDTTGRNLQALLSGNVPSVHEWASKQGREELVTLVSRQKAAEHAIEVKSGLREYASPIDWMDEFLALPAEKFGETLLGIDHGAIEEFTQIAFTAEFAIKVPESLTEGGILIYKTIVLHEAKKRLKALKNDGDSRAPVLQRWISEQEGKLKHDAALYSLRTGILITRSVKLFLKHADSFSETAGMGYTPALVLFSTAYEAFQLRRKIKDAGIQKEWIQELEKPVSKKLEELVNRRRKVEKNRDVPGYHAWLKREDRVDSDDSFKLYLDDRETKRVLTRNALKAHSLHKQKSERKLLKIRLNKYKLKFSTKVIAFTILLTLKTLAFAGAIALPTLALAMTGVGLFAASVILLFAGIYILHKYRPNLLKTLLHGVQLRITLYHVPEQIAKWRYHSKAFKQYRYAEKITHSVHELAELERRLIDEEIIQLEEIPKPLRKQLHLSDKGVLTREMLKKGIPLFNEEMIDRAATIRKEIREKADQLHKWQEKLSPLRKRVTEAKYADYIRISQLSSEKYGNIDLAEVITDGLLEDHTLIDPESLEILKDEMAIDLTRIKFEKKDEVRKDVVNAIKDFYSLDDKALILRIKERKKQEVRRSIA